MRYAKCTSEDISFLRTLQARQRPDQPKFSAKKIQKCADNMWQAYSEEPNKLNGL